MTRIPVYKPNTATISNTDPPFFKVIFPEHTHAEQGQIRANSPTVFASGRKVRASPPGSGQN